MNGIFNILNPDNTITVNRPLAHALGLSEAITYAALIAKCYYYMQRDMLDNGWFYSTVPDLQESTALSEYQQKRCITNLVKSGLIRTENRGMPAKRSFIIVDDIELLQKYIADGEEILEKVRPNAAKSYEQKRNSKPDEPEIAEEARENPHNKAVSPCSEETSEQAPKKLQSLLQRNCGTSSKETSEQHFIKTKENKPKGNQSIYPHTENEKTDRIDRIEPQTQKIQDNCARMLEERAAYSQLIRDNIDYDCLIELHSSDTGQIDELVSLMTDVVCSAKPTIRVNGEEIPQQAVKAAMLKLNSDHIGYVLTALKKNTSKVGNIRSYLITALYNASATIDSYYRAEVNHDMYG